MSFNTMVIRQRDFSAGEIDPDSIRRDDLDIFKFGVRYARNLQTMPSGALERRFGRSMRFVETGRTDQFQPFHDGLKYSLSFGGGYLNVRDQNDTVLQTLAAPWSADIVPKLVWDFYENRTFICGPGMRTQVVSVDENSRVWSIADFQFDRKLSGTYLAPFYRFGNKGVTMQVSAISDSGITVTFSANVLNPAHVGTIFRYAGRQLRIDSVSSGTIASATALERLAPTVRYVFADSTELYGFTVGETAETSVSGVQIEIIAIDIVGKTVTGVILNQYRQRDPSDRLVGPNADANTEDMSVVTPGATTQWTEIFMSDYRGWPQSVSVDDNRIIFCDFPQFKAAIIWSAVDDPMNYLIEASSDTSAIFEYLQADCRVFHVVGGYDEFAITDRGVFYIPVSGDNPLKPGSVEFNMLYSGRVSSVRPVQVTEGALFVDDTGTGIYAISATGAQSRPYQVTELTEGHRHLFNGIVAIGSNAGTSQNASRQIYVVNGDGSVVLGQYNVSRQYVGWLKHNGQGIVKDVCTRFDEAKFLTVYPRGTGTISVVEENDSSVKADCSLAVVNGAVSGLFSGATMQVWADGFYLGDVVIGAGGVVPGVGGFTNVIVGYLFSWSLSPLFQQTEGGNDYKQNLRRRRIVGAVARVEDTQEFQMGSRLVAGYVGGDDFAAPMPLRSDTYKIRVLGRDFDPQLPLQQTFPGEFKLLELTTEITI
ncbi:hypothetical protein [Rhizobium rhizogenes]|uniref:hypothetical protein n=1 Tax=Rhizobium rhizogenes TaxID=359 RepID=UPI0015743C94|nr:hypothetical protein [Rhizobium rhizogenes]NTG94254.1 hypothetical protein [Rhizobium rhizogenes]